MKKKISKVKQLEEDVFSCQLFTAFVIFLSVSAGSFFYFTEYKTVNDSLQIIKACNRISLYNEKYSVHHSYGDEFSCRIGNYDIEDVEQLEQLKLLEIAR
jgi:hypothetical protein